MQDRKEEQADSRSSRWENNARHYVGDSVKFVVGKVGFFAAKLTDAGQYLVTAAKENCCKTRPGKKTT